MTVVKPTNSTISQASATLRDGGVVAFATETVYGIGCDIYNEKAIDLVYEMKGRPRDNPMIAHVLDVSWAHQISCGWNQACELLSNNFWPGPLTLILERDKSVPKLACGGLDTIAIRCPSHPVARQLLTSFNGPIVAPSANRSGRISSTTAAHVENEFPESLPIIDGGPCSGGIESTILSMVGEPALLRLGSVSVKEIEQVIGVVRVIKTTTQSSSPGTTAKHYAPETKVKLLSCEEVNAFKGENSVVICIRATPILSKQHFQMPTLPKEYAKKLYAILREADAIGAREIIIEKPENSPEWNAIHDRLCRCSSG